MDPTSEIEGLRKESADRRVKLKPFLEAFEGWSEGQQTYMLGVIRTLGQDTTRERGYRELLELAQAGVRAYDGDPPEEEAVEESDTPPKEKPMTDTPDLNDEISRRIAEEVAKQRKEMESEYEENLARERTNIEIDAQARALGYEPGTSKFAQLMHHASRLEGGETMTISESLQAAHGKVLGDIADLLGTGAEPAPEPEPEKLPEPEQEAPKFSPSAKAGGSGGPIEHPDENQPKDWAGARESFVNFMAAQDGQPVN